jgi:hypothetical protein
VRLAHLLGVGIVATMSGTPGGRQPGGTGVFGCWSVVPDDERLHDWQFSTWLEPFWPAAAIGAGHDLDPWRGLLAAMRAVLAR